MNTRSLTFEKQATNPLGDIYDITSPIPNGNMVLSSARFDIILATPNDYASIPKSVSLEVGTVIGNEYVIDNDVSQNFFKVILELNIVTVGATTYLSSVTNPNTSFKMNGDLQRRCVFRIRDGTTGEILQDNKLTYFCVHFTIV